MEYTGPIPAIVCMIIEDKICLALTVSQEMKRHSHWQVILYDGFSFFGEDITAKARVWDGWYPDKRNKRES